MQDASKAPSDRQNTASARGVVGTAVGTHSGPCNGESAVSRAGRPRKYCGCGVSITSGRTNLDLPGTGERLGAGRAPQGEVT